MVDKGGTVYACCEPPLDSKSSHNPLILGNLYRDPLPAILARAEKSAFIQALRQRGPGYLAQVAIDRGMGNRLKGVYPRDSVCEVCHDMLRDEEVVATVLEGVD